MYRGHNRADFKDSFNSVSPVPGKLSKEIIHITNSNTPVMPSVQ